MDRIDIIHGNLTHFTHLLAQAATLGYEDAKSGRKRKRSSQELVEQLCTCYRQGHAKYIHHAYSGGWWMYEMEATTVKLPTTLKGRGFVLQRGSPSSRRACILSTR